MMYIHMFYMHAYVRACTHTCDRACVHACDRAFVHACVFCIYYNTCSSVDIHAANPINIVTIFPFFLKFLIYILTKVLF